MIQNPDQPTSLPSTSHLKVHSNYHQPCIIINNQFYSLQPRIHVLGLSLVSRTLSAISIPFCPTIQNPFSPSQGSQPSFQGFTPNPSHHREVPEYIYLFNRSDIQGSRVRETPSRIAGLKYIWHIFKKPLNSFARMNPKTLSTDQFISRANNAQIVEVKKGLRLYQNMSD